MKVGERYIYIGSVDKFIVEILKLNSPFNHSLPYCRCIHIIKTTAWRLGEESAATVGSERYWKLLPNQNSQ